MSLIKEAAITKSLSNIWIDIEKVTSEAIHEKFWSWLLIVAVLQFVATFFSRTNTH